MTWEPGELPVPAGANVDATDVDRTAVDAAAVDPEVTDFGRASLLVWRPLLEAESSR